MSFTDAQIQRYSRHIILPEVGGKGQQKLSRAKALIIGAGGLGSPAGLYLAAAGVGTLGLVDGDVVDLSNLQRQILHTTASVGASKVESGRRMLAALNPEITIKTYQENITAANILMFLAEYDIILDGSDNFSTRFLLYDALEMKFRKVTRPKDPRCPLCGTHPTITDLSGDYTVSCAL